MKGGRLPLPRSLLDHVKREMHEIADANLPIMKRSVNTDEAIALFHKHHMYDKERLFNYRRVSRVNLYSIENFEDYFYGFMACDTGYIQYFDLVLYEEGFVLYASGYAQEPDKIPEFVPQDKIFQVQKESEEWGDKLEISTVGELNDQITSQGNTEDSSDPGGYAGIQDFQRSPEQIAKAGDKKFVMIAGPSSSGKTTFSHRLSIQLAAHGMKPHPIAVDNYFVEQRRYTCEMNTENRIMNVWKPLMWSSLTKICWHLLDGKRVELPVFNFKTGQREYKGDYSSAWKG